MSKEKNGNNEDIYEDIDRNLYLFDDIDQETSERFCSSLFKTADKILKCKEDLLHSYSELAQTDFAAFELKYNDLMKINVFINTDGGAVKEMLGMIDCMEHVQTFGITISTIGVGGIYSAGLGILAAGTIGQRKIGKNARLMFHDVSNSISGKLRNLKAEMKETERDKNQYLSILSKYSGQSRKFFEDILKKDNGVDYYFDPNEALEWGIVDMVLQHITK
jgi:ATP-dependent Clp endopeptidase proteolytic subunit ClpP